MRNINNFNLQFACITGVLFIKYKLKATRHISRQKLFNSENSTAKVLYVATTLSVCRSLSIWLRY